MQIHSFLVFFKKLRNDWKTIKYLKNKWNSEISKTQVILNKNGSR